MEWLILYTIKLGLSISHDGQITSECEYQFPVYHKIVITVRFRSIKWKQIVRNWWRSVFINPVPGRQSIWYCMSVFQVQGKMYPFWVIPFLSPYEGGGSNFQLSVKYDKLTKTVIPGLTKRALRRNIHLSILQIFDSLKHRWTAL